MDYQRHYQALMSRAKNRQMSGYVERHRILPGCMGGTYDDDNVVMLTPEEHYLAHQLLVKMHPGSRDLIWAAWQMTSGNSKQTARFENKKYGWLRREFAKSVSLRFKGKPLSQEHRTKLSIAAKMRKRRPHSEATKAKMSKLAKGKKKSHQHCLAIAKAKTGIKKGPHSDEWKMNQRAGIVAACAKLTIEDIDGIRIALANGEKQTDIAKRFKVDPSRISKIKLGQLWSKHITTTINSGGVPSLPS